ncbi:MAG: hypothetical protein QXS21_05485 [Thermoproteota archaeon]
MVKRKKFDSGSLSGYRGKVGSVIKSRIDDPADAQAKLEATVQNWEAGYKPFNTLWSTIRGYLQANDVPVGEWGVVRSFAFQLYKEMKNIHPARWDELRSALIDKFAVKYDKVDVLEDVADLVVPA